MGGLFSSCQEEKVPLLVPSIPGTVRIIGIAGKAGSGKDTIAESLVEQEGFTRFAFADPLKNSVSNLFGIPLQHLNHRVSKETVNETWQKSPRQLLQWLGDSVRSDISKDFFVVLMAERINVSGAQKVVISDVRYEQEARFIRRVGGEVVELTRENAFNTMGIQEASHSSEKALPRSLVDYKIANDGSKQDLYEIIKELI